MSTPLKTSRQEEESRRKPTGYHPTTYCYPICPSTGDCNCKISGPEEAACCIGCGILLLGAAVGAASADCATGCQHDATQLTTGAVLGCVASGLVVIISAISWPFSAPCVGATAATAFASSSLVGCSSSLMCRTCQEKSIPEIYKKDEPDLTKPFIPPYIPDTTEIRVQTPHLHHNHNSGYKSW